MAVNYTTVKPPDDGSRTGGLGKRNQQNVSAIFSSSPIYKENDYTPGAVENLGNSTLGGTGGAGDEVSGNSTKNGVTDDGGYMFNQVDLRFAGRRKDGTVEDAYAAPDLATVKTGGEGLPSTPYTPNPTSPGAGNGIDPSQMPEFTGEAPSGGDPSLAASKQFGRGDGSSANPAKTSAELTRSTIGNYMLGSSKSV